jgi:predicted DsbA family dithiol-disulfide isomerase
MAARFIVYSDYLCPWCNVAAVRLRQLRDELGSDLELEWRSYLLRPQPDPRRTLEKFREYTRSWLRPAAEEPAAEFQVWSSDEGPPSHSLPPHLVAKAASELGPDAFERMHERLLRAYFAENRDITTEATLRALWREVGLDPAGFERSLDADVADRVLAEHNEAVELGVGGVPSVRADGSDVAITGAHPVEMYRRWVKKLL